MVSLRIGVILCDAMLGGEDLPYNNINSAARRPAFAVRTGSWAFKAVREKFVGSLITVRPFQQALSANPKGDL